MSKEIIYQAQIKQIGHFAQDILIDGMLIFFKEGAPEDLADYCFIHSHGELKAPLQVGQTLQIGPYSYHITAVGEVANANFRELGHITLRFDGSEEAELPGTVHIDSEIPPKLSVGDEIIIFNN